jgi:type III restriction enzyme
MRLPFGVYTGIEILDTLEVVAHERYEDLLKKAGVLNEAFIDYRTRAVLRKNAQGETVVVTETTETQAPFLIGEAGTPPLISDGVAAPAVTSVQERTTQASKAALKMKRAIERNPDAPTIVIPVLRMTAVESNFSLADIAETDEFRRLGAKLASNPDGELNRTLVGARVVMGSDGIKRTELVRSEAADHIRSIPSLFALPELRDNLTDIVLASPAVPARPAERKALQPFLDAFFDGLGEKAEEVLSANLERAAARLVRLVADEQRRFMAKPTYGEVIKLEDFLPVRTTDKDVTDDRLGPFAKVKAYEGWARSLFPVEWFDSAPERAVANMVDTDKTVRCWVRLHIKELPILWNSYGQQYNPDLIVIDTDGTHWVVESKMNKEMESEDVLGKREAAMRWANHVSAAAEVGVQWRYLLVSETDIETSKGSWKALKKLGS